MGRDLSGIGLAFMTELYQKYSRSLYWACLHQTGNSEDAEEMVHHVFMKITVAGVNFPSHKNNFTSIYRIAMKECIQLFKKRKIRSIEGTKLERPEN